jgi:hypothetical protein
MKIPRLGVAQHFTNKVNWVLDLLIVFDSPISTTMVVLAHYL